MCYVGGLLWRFGNLIKWVVSNRNVSNAGFEENSNLRTSKGVLAQLVAPFHRFHTKIVCVSLFEGTPCLLQMLCILVFSTFLPRTPYYLCYLCVATIFVSCPVSCKRQSWFIITTTTTVLIISISISIITTTTKKQYLSSESFLQKTVLDPVTSIFKRKQIYFQKKTNIFKIKQIYLQKQHIFCRRQFWIQLQRKSSGSHFN